MVHARLKPAFTQAGKQKERDEQKIVVSMLEWRDLAGCLCPQQQPHSVPPLPQPTTFGGGMSDKKLSAAVHKLQRGGAGGHADDSVAEPDTVTVVSPGGIGFGQRKRKVLTWRQHDTPLKASAKPSPAQPSAPTKRRKRPPEPSRVILETGQLSHCIGNSQFQMPEVSNGSHRCL